MKPNRSNVESNRAGNGLTVDVDVESARAREYRVPECEERKSETFVQFSSRFLEIPSIILLKLSHSADSSLL